MLLNGFENQRHEIEPSADLKHQPCILMRSRQQEERFDGRLEPDLCRRRGGGEEEEEMSHDVLTCPRSPTMSG